MIGMRYLTAVVNSARYWPKPPSPVTDTTLRVPRVAGPGADRRREAEADRAEVAGHQHVLAAAALEVVPERVGVVADVDGDHGVVGHERCRRRAKTAAGWMRPSGVGQPRRAGLLGAPPRPCARRSPLAALRPLDGGQARSSSVERAADVAPQRHLTGWNLPSVIRSRSTWIVGTQVAMPVWFENDAPSTSRQSALAIVAGRPGCRSGRARRRRADGRRRRGPWP